MQALGFGAGESSSRCVKRTYIDPITSADATGLGWTGVVVQVDGAESGVDDSNNRRDRVHLFFLGAREDRQEGGKGRERKKEKKVVAAAAAVVR